MPGDRQEAMSSLSEQSAVSLQRQAEKVDDHHYWSTVDKHLIVKFLGMTEVLSMLQSLTCLARTSLQHDLVDLIYMAYSSTSHACSLHTRPHTPLLHPEGYCYFYPYNATTLDGWLWSPTLEKLQELDLNTNYRVEHWSIRLRMLPVPASVHRFSSTLRIASFSAFDFPAVRSFGVRSRWKGIKPEHLLVVDAPCLQRLLFFEGRDMYISVISAPRMDILGKLFDNLPKLEFSATVFQGSIAVGMTTVVHSVKVLALSDVKLSLVAIIDLLKCFPCLEKLYIKATSGWVENAWYHKYQKLIGTLDIRLRKIVLANYQGSKSHIDFAKFFVSNARVLESMRLQAVDVNISKDWISRQRSLLNVKKRASRGVKFIFVVSPKILIGSLDVLHAEQVHDLSTTDPFQRFHQ
ncbi:uncharacterized protein [Miscanthus floridulus]|uniref:uncharacterized protein n=1 Tax=Miscanthus floridulus TaxID=154761 RepID=UPI003459C788